MGAQGANAPQIRERNAPFICFSLATSERGVGSWLSSLDFGTDVCTSFSRSRGIFVGDIGVSGDAILRSGQWKQGEQSLRTGKYKEEQMGEAGAEKRVRRGHLRHESRRYFRRRTKGRTGLHTAPSDGVAFEPSMSMQKPREDLRKTLHIGRVAWPSGRDVEQKGIRAAAQYERKVWDWTHGDRFCESQRLANPGWTAPTKGCGGWLKPASQPRNGRV